MAGMSFVRPDIGDIVEDWFDDYSGNRSGKGVHMWYKTDNEGFASSWLSSVSYSHDYVYFEKGW